MRFVLRCHIDMSFRILFRTVLTIALPVSLFSLPVVERATAPVVCLMSSILRKSDPEYFLSYLRFVSTCYSVLCNVGNTRFPKVPHCVVLWLTGVPIKFSVNGITIDPGPVLGVSIPQGCLHPLVWIHPSPTPFCPLGVHGAQARMWISGVETRK